ncbi:hypothetical protein [Phytomonospora endophytica]|uniref:Uncharacterized protein n=1 Tax=Phytomonospora endophytica TaxID=714109 RepID=A0A841FQ58_9ACTN|nr:hypothetical protein [Phytomonospora endophytica]MBB6034090.1 hypothetical protein [Phytomonospora endophytica]GIG66484.1 hypothetical protein Pen01_27790 [Phytomonospora endophytica]
MAGIHRRGKIAATTFTDRVPADALPAAADPVGDLGEREEILVDEAEWAEADAIEIGDRGGDGVGAGRSLTVELRDGVAGPGFDTDIIGGDLVQGVVLFVGRDVIEDHREREDRHVPATFLIHGRDLRVCA